MCHSRGLNHKINNMHKEKKSSFETLLKRDKSTSIHMKNLQYVAKEWFKVKNGLSPESWKKSLFFKKMKLTI